MKLNLVNRLLSLDLFLNLETGRTLSII